jgi:hypothetical protein
MTNEVDKFVIRMLYPSANNEQDWSMSIPDAYQSCIEKKGFEDEIRLGLQLCITNTYMMKRIPEQDIP